MVRRRDRSNGAPSVDAGRDGAEVELGEIIVEPTPNGGKVEPSKEEEPAEDADEDDDEERFCRICLEPVSFDSIRDGKSLGLGCACKSGYMHKTCAWEYVQVKKTKPVTCEVCLEDMTALDPIAELQGGVSGAAAREGGAAARERRRRPRSEGGSHVRRRRPEGSQAVLGESQPRGLAVLARF